MAGKKLPRPFRKPVEEGRYVRKVLNRIYLEPDREYLKTIFAADDAGLVRPVRELSADELKRLKKLSKDVRRNRGVAQKGKLALLLIIIAATVLFDLAFKNMLVTRAGDQLLQSVFQARADLSGVDFRPLRGTIAFAALTVADSNHPMANLFELGRTRLDVDILELLRGHVVISRMEANGIRWGTARKTSGAILGAGAASGRRGDGASPSAPAIASVLESLNLPVPGSFDAKSFVARHAADLKTLARIDYLSQQANELTQSWKDRVASLSSAAQNAADEAAKVSAIDVNGIKTLDAAITAYKQVQDGASSISKADIEAKSAFKEASTDVAAFGSQTRELPALVSADSRYLISLIPEVSGGGRQIITRLVEACIRPAIGSWRDRLQQAFSVVSRLADQKGRAGRPRTRRLPGRTVTFPSAAAPRFWLKDASFDAEDAPGTLALAGQLRAVSSDPDLIAQPATFDFSGTNRGSSLTIHGSVDGRRGAADRVYLSASSEGIPLDLRDGLDALDISAVTGKLGLATNLSLKADGGAEGRLELLASSIAVAGGYARDSFGGIVADALQQGTPLDVTIAYRIAADGSITFPSGSSNLDAVLSSVLRGRAGEMAAALQSRVRSELDSLVASREPEIDAAKAQVQSVGTAVQTQLDSVTAARDRAAEVQKRLDARIASIKAQTQNQAQQQLQNQLNSLQKGLKLPGLGQ